MVHWLIISYNCGVVRCVVLGLVVPVLVAPPTSTLVSPLGTILVLVLIVEVTSASATLVIKPLVEVLLELAALVIETLVVSIVVIVVVGIVVKIGRAW